MELAVFTQAMDWGAVRPYLELVGLLLAVGLYGCLGIVVDPVTLEKGLKTNFYLAYEAATPFHPTLATEVPSTAKDEKYAWLGTAPTMREWVDERVPKGLLDHSYTIVNKHYEASIGVDRDHLEDDQTNQINKRVQDMASRVRRHPDGRLSTLIIDGESTLCYDGQNFFDTDHVEGDSGTQSNDLTGTVSDTSNITQAEFKTLFGDALEALLGFKDDRGEPFLEEWMLTNDNLKCMVPRQMRQVALETLSAELISNTTNIYKNKAEVLVNARLTSGVKFYLFYTGAPVKPFIFQNRQPVRTGFLGDNAETGFMRREWVFGADARYNLGYGLWQFGVLTTVS